MTLVDQAANVRKRIRRDGDLTVIGLTPRIGDAHLLLWRIGSGPVRETKDRAIASANGRIGWNKDRKTVLTDEIVTADDVRQLHEACLRALNSGQFVCSVDYSPLGTDGHCPEHVAELTRWDV